MMSNIQNLVYFIFNESCFMTGCTSHPSGRRACIKSLLTIRARVRTNVNPPFCIFVILLVISGSSFLIYGHASTWLTRKCAWPSGNLLSQ